MHGQVILAISILLQFSAAILALMQIRLTRHRTAWVCIALALVMMGARRSVTLAHTLGGGTLSSPDVTAELIALGISVLMLVGVWRIGAMFREQIETEAALRESEELWRTYIDKAPMGILVVDGQGRYLDLNPGTEAITGCTREELLDMHIHDLLVEESREAGREHFARVRRDGHAEGEMLKQRKDGSRFWSLTMAVRLSEDRYLGFMRDVTARRHAEQALRSSEERFSRAFHSAPLLMTISSLDEGRYIEVNEAFVRATGYTRERAIGQTSVELGFVAADDRRRMLELLDASGHLRDFELELSCADGSKMLVLYSGEIIEMDGERRLLSIAADISARKRAEGELQKALEFSNTLLRAVPTPIFYKDREGRYLGCNDAFTRLMGVSDEQIRGKTVHELWPGPQAEVYHQKDMELLRRPEGQIYEFEVRDKDGRNRSVLFAKDVFRDETGRVAGMLGAFLDITDRKHMEKALRESEFQKDLILNATQEMVAYYDTDLRIIWANRASAHSVGKEPGELVGKYCHEVWHERSEPCENCPVLRAAQTGEPVFDEMTTPDGRVWFLRGYPVINGGGQVTALVEFGQDITDRKCDEERLRASLREKEVLLREIHHRVKNNMQAIVSLLRMHSRQAEDPRQRGQFEDCRDRIHAMSLIHEALYQSEDLARIDFEQYLRKLCKNLERVHGARVKGVQVRVEHSDVRLGMDQGIALGMVIAELVSNAFKHAFSDEGGGTLSLSIRKSDDRTVELSVADDGCGIPPEVEPEASESLGLRLVHATVTRELGGSLELHRENGSCFVIRFPVSTQEDKA